MALLLLPYPDALSLQTISPFYCKAAVLPRNPLAAARFPDSFEKGNTFREHTPHERTWARGAWPGRGAPRRRTRPARGGARDAGTSRGAAIRPRPQGQGLREPAAGRCSAGSRRARRRSAARPRRRRAGSGRRSPSSASSRARAAAGAGSPERATYFPPAAGAPARTPSPATAQATTPRRPALTAVYGRRARPRSALAPTSAGRQASVRSGRGTDDSLPAAESPHPALIIIPSGRAAGCGEGVGPSCACAGRASL